VISREEDFLLREVDHGVAHGVGLIAGVPEVNLPLPVVDHHPVLEGHSGEHDFHQRKLPGEVRHEALEKRDRRKARSQRLPAHALEVLALCVSTAVAGCLLPVWRVVRMPIARALRHA